MKTKRLIFTLMIVFSFTACKNEKQNANENTNNKTETIPNSQKDIGEKTLEAKSLISQGTVAGFSIGGKIPGATLRYSMETKSETHATEGRPVSETFHILYADGEKHLVLKPKYGNKDKIGEILVFDEEYHTKEGIGVGSTIGEFVKTYPNHKIWYTYVSDRYIIQNSKSSIQFILDENGFVGKKEIKSAKTTLESSDFKEGTAIRKIRVFE